MRIRKRRAQEVDRLPTEPSGSSAAALHRADHNDRVEIGSERFELVTRSGGEAAALSLVLLAAEGVPHIAQEYKTRQNFFRRDSGVRSRYQTQSADSLSRKEKADRSSNNNAKAASGQFTTEGSRKSPQVHFKRVPSRMHETGSHITSSSDGDLPTEKIGGDEEKLARTDSDFEDGSSHPSNQPEGSLTHSLCCIFAELPGNVGLSAREALSKIQERGLPGLIEGEGVPSVQVAKIMRSNPCFVPVRGGKYLFSRFPERVDSERNERAPNACPKDESHKTRGAKSQSESGNGRISSSSKDVPPTITEKEVTGISGPSQIDVVGTRCTRVDGRSWQCRRTSMPGFSLCEHHHLQLSSQSRRQRNFQRAFNQSSRKRLRKGEKRGDAKGEAQDGNRTANAESGRRKVVKARSLEAIVRGTVDVGSVNSSPSIR
ncbi:hypothetical protein MPTK1_5g24030 [Marchantia polymorpha subsp. ruderalis]|uniref:WRC domain-containing protein n=1 Tax=Marchantia polymorpha subsp. ruderalis TaxID=1480154 RepID=A0AAF6BLP1_MARPO|nr:hypothetical protein Mp_5g24030 [Marchantia polymorpha subsp. ruderalis]BBN12925.1 hypothetical protein Mp_5g24030 [Marchantia polymorpha subsp. ruderalis]